MTDDILVEAAMQIILNAGDAREKLSLALKEAKGLAFHKAREVMVDTEALIQKAHKEQTTIIQAEARGEQQKFSLLFIHAQDTLMTVNSEFRLTGELIDILELIDARLQGGKKN